MSDRPVLSEPLTAEEEAAYRAALAGPYRDDRWSGDHVARLLATLDAARSATPSSEEDGLVCPHCEEPITTIECDACGEGFATPDNAGRSSIDDLRALSEKATPGPWRQTGTPAKPHWYVTSDAAQVHGNLPPTREDYHPAPADVDDVIAVLEVRAHRAEKRAARSSGELDVDVLAGALINARWYHHGNLEDAREAGSQSSG